MRESSRGGAQPRVSRESYYEWPLPREIGATRGGGRGKGPIGGEVARRPLGKVGFDLCRRARRPIYLYKLLHKI